MSIIVEEVDEPIHLWQGRTLDYEWALPNAAGTGPEDLTDWHAWLLIWGKQITDPVQALSDATGVAPTPSAQGTTGIILGGLLGTIRAYLTDEDAANITTESFDLVRVKGEGQQYLGRYELVLENPAGERYTWETGPVRFHPTAVPNG